MLVPAGVLVLFILGSIAVDASIAFLAQRELTSAAAAAANDAAGAAVSDEAFYRVGGGAPGQIVLNQREAADLADDALRKREVRGVSDVEQDVQVSLDQVCVTITGRVEYIFAKAIPGARRGRRVTGQAVATAVVGQSGTVLVRKGDACRR